MRFLMAAVAALLLVSGTGPGSAASVSKGQREAIIFLVDLSQGSSLERQFYDVVEFAAISLAQASLTPNYQKVTTVQGSGSTLGGLRQALKTAASKSTVRAVDLIFVTHGLSSEVLFRDGRKTANQVRDEITNNLTSAERNKLRMVFSTACFGTTHRTAWRNAGFRTVSGSEGIYADSALSYPAFLAAWVAGQSFSSAVGIANGIDPFRISDNAAKAWFDSKNQRDLSRQVNSVRVISGSGSLKIDNIP